MSTAADPRDRTAAALPGQYDPAAVEAPLYERWVQRGYFTADPTSGRPTYCIVIPPPNVTGSLHMGHALDHSVQDALIRWRRMQGYEALWLPGMDHAGIATQNVVERELARDGVTRFDLGRERFVERVWSWKQEYGGRILGQMRRLGDSVDWTRERFTMDPGLSRAVRTIFKRLFDDGLIYRAERIINWCPRCHTALSDIEVEHHEDEGELVSLRYGDAGGDPNGSIVVATTRVETMLGDTAVAVHPDDDRYRHLVGREIELPLTGRRIPVVADDHVDPEFGTGAVKVTPAHDPNDFEIGQRHGLPALQVIDEQARIANTGLEFDGMDRFAARAAVKEALRAQGRVVAERAPYLHAVGHCSRCDTVVEPRLSLQWFVRVESLARAAGDAVRDGRVAFHPPEMARRYFDWVDHMHDWCISRQLWWGHRIPVWYGLGGELRCPGPDEPDPGEGWTQDPDVLDTWFSSALWPFSTLGWPERTADLAAFYPTDVLVTGPDIIFFWVARMMMFGLYAMEDVPPFGAVALHGLVRDEHGKKMSKSRGNTIDPMELIDSYGADALRFTLLRGANPGTDLALSEDWVQGSRNFCNKLWNATRFALLNGAGAETPVPDAGELTAADRWLLSRLHGLLADVDELLTDFQLAKVVEALYHFAWDEFCDWYVEIAKTQLDEASADAARVQTTRAVLGHALDALLRALHPIAPFVTETLWTALTGAETVTRAPWPVSDPTRLDAPAEAELADLRAVVTEVRRFRADQGVRPGQWVPARISTAAASPLAAHEAVIRALTRLEPAGADFRATATLPVAGVEIALDLSGAIDVAAERARLGKDLQAAQAEIRAAEAKLGNPQFVAKAPPPVVDKVRGRLDSARADTERLQRQLDALPAS